MAYSSLPNKRTGLNKRTGWNFDQNTGVQGKNWQLIYNNKKDF